ncbi:MAG: hypothetical protein IJ790_00970 [Lachnospiraceae bacterium]|nr:hypothetical protein [Lachnospiraceae bacterium]
MAFSPETYGAVKKWTQEYVSGVIGSTGIKVGTIDQNSTGFPTTRGDGSALHKEDYVAVSSSATLPFTLGGLRFSNKLDRAVWAGSAWAFSAGSVVESDEVSISNSATESISGTATTQSGLNIENKTAIANLQTLCNTLDEEYKKAGFTFTAITTTLDGIDTTVLNVKDKKGNNLLNIDLMGAMSGQELLDAIKDLPAELTNKIIDCGSFNP